MPKTKDYSKYFTTPNLKEARKRSKEKTQTLQYEISEEMKNIGVGKSYYIKTYGCQMNERDSEIIAGILEEMQYQKSENLEDADVIIFNTCAVRETAESKVYGAIGALKHLKLHNPDLIIGLCGCMSQEEKTIQKILTKYPQIDLIFGTHNYYRLPILLKEAILSKEKVIEVWSKEGDIVEGLPSTREYKHKAFINIMYGCDKFCTYCIVPYTRGKERSRKMEDIMKEVRALEKKGYQEITLLGQNVNAYGKDLKDVNYGFSTLLREIQKTTIPRVRFTTSHPWDFTEELIDVIASGKNLMPYIHLPVQSGSNEILKKMGRGYTRESYLELFKLIKKKIPNVTVTTDIIVGFPGETEKDFEDTLSLVKECQFDGAYTFIYSKREGTPAAKMRDDVPLEEKKRRLEILNKLVDENALKSNKKSEGKVVEVLVDGVNKKDENKLVGYTETNKLVHFIGNKKYIGKIVPVKITKVRTWILDGELYLEEKDS